MTSVIVPQLPLRRSLQCAADDPLGDVIAADPAVVDRLIAMDEWFSFLTARSQLPIDKSATIRAIAAEAHLPVANVLSAVNTGLGAPCCARQADDHDEDPPEAPPAWLAEVETASTVRVDVRPLLAARQNPFTAVVLAVNQVPVDRPFTERRLQAEGWRSRGLQSFPCHEELGLSIGRKTLRRAHEGAQGLRGREQDGVCRAKDEEQIANVIAYLERTSAQ